MSKPQGAQLDADPVRSQGVPIVLRGFENDPRQAPSLVVSIAAAAVGSDLAAGAYPLAQLDSRFVAGHLLGATVRDLQVSTPIPPPHRS